MWTRQIAGFPGPVLAIVILAASGAAVFGSELDHPSAEIARKYRMASEAFGELSFRFVTTAVDPGNADVVSYRGETRVARKGQMIFSERLMDAPFAAKQPNMARTGMSYDGKESRALAMKGRATIYPGHHPDVFRNQDDFLGLQGYPAPGYDIILPNGGRASCDIAELLQTADFELSVDDDRVIAAGPGQRLTFDRSKSFALISRELFDTDVDRPFEVHSVSELFEVVPSVWIGRAIVIEQFNAGVPIRTATLRLLGEPVMSVPDDTFLFPFPANTLVEDFRELMDPKDRGPKEGTPLFLYTIPANPDDLEKVVAAAKALRRIQTTDHTKGAVARSWLLIGNVMIVIALVAATGYHQWMTSCRR